ncbi:MAG: hypothetical protein ACM3YO_04495 [Bacteroidota bacterium]
MGFDIKKISQAFGGIFGKKAEKPTKGKSKKGEEKKKSPSRSLRDDARYAPGAPRIKKAAEEEEPSIRPKKAGSTSLKKGAPKPSPKPPVPQKSILETQRTTMKGKYLQQSALMVMAIDQGSLDRLKELVGKLGDTPMKLTNSGSQRAKSALATSTQLQQAIEDKFGPILELSTTLARDTAGLTDEAMKIAARWLNLSKKLINSAEIHDLEAAKTHAAELIDQSCLLEGSIQTKEQTLNNFKVAFEKGMQAKDFFSLSNQAEALARDAAVLSILHPAEEKPVEIPKGERLEVIREIARRLQLAVGEKQYGTVAAYASALSVHCGLAADNNSVKAQTVLKHATALKQILQGAEGSAEESLSGIQQHGSTFTGAMLDRQKRASESIPLLKQATFSKDITGLASASNKLWRALSFTHDPDLARANAVATQSIKLDAAIKSGDREKAIQILSKSV